MSSVNKLSLFKQVESFSQFPSRWSSGVRERNWVLLNDALATFDGTLENTIELILDCMGDVEIYEECLDALCSLITSLEAVAKVTVEKCEQVPATCALFGASSSALCHIFSHLNDSENVYGKHFDQLTASLTRLFNDAIKLQSVYVLLSDRVECPDSSDCTLKVSQIANGYRDVAIAVKHLQPKIQLGLWKSYVHFIRRFAILLKDSLCVDETIQYFCGRFVEWVEDLKKCGPNWTPDEFVPTLKLHTAFFKVATFLMENFSSNIDTCVTDIVTFSAIICQISVVDLPQNSMFNSTCVEQVFSAFYDVVSNWSRHVLGSSKFFDKLAKDGSKNSNLGLLLYVTQLLELYSTKMDNRHLKSLIDLAFDLIDTHTAEFGMSLTIKDGGVEKSVYDVIASRLCITFALPNNQSYLDALLVKRILSVEFWSSLLACDIVKFLLRFRTSDSDTKYCEMWLQALLDCFNAKSFSCFSSLNVVSLLRYIRQQFPEFEDYFSAFEDADGISQTDYSCSDNVRRLRSDVLLSTNVQRMESSIIVDRFLQLLDNFSIVEGLESTEVLGALILALCSAIFTMTDEQRIRFLRIVVGLSYWKCDHIGVIVAIVCESFATIDIENESSDNNCPASKISLYHSWCSKMAEAFKLDFRKPPQPPKNDYSLSSSLPVSNIESSTMGGLGIDKNTTADDNIVQPSLKRHRTVDNNIGSMESMDYDATRGKKDDQITDDVIGSLMAVEKRLKSCSDEDLYRHLGKLQAFNRTLQSIILRLS